MSGQEPDDFAGLFDEELIDGLTGDPRRFVDRARPVAEVDRFLADPGCRVVLLLGGAGTGKTSLLATLARRNPGWPRYFIRRAAENDTLYSHDGGLASFLTVVGLQLARRQPNLFKIEANLDVRTRVGVVEPGATVQAVRLDRVIISPFTDLNISVAATAERVAGELTVVRVGEIVEAAYAAPQALEKPAILEPALRLADLDRDGRIVILLDGTDELRLRDTSVDVLTWVSAHQAFPGNVRFVISSRPDDERLRPLLERTDVRTVSLDPADDAGIGDDLGVSSDTARFARLIAEGEGIQRALRRASVSPERFADYATSRAQGNFRYLALLGDMIEAAGDDPSADIDWLAADEDRWPDTLYGLYQDYLLRTRDRVGRTSRTLHAWEQVYLPVLAILTVAEASLTVAQIEAYGGIQGTGTESCATALKRLSQLLHARGGAYRLDHASLADFLADERTGSPLRIEPGYWHARIADYAFARYGKEGSWRAADHYLLVSLPVHAEVAGRLDELIEDPAFLVVADLGDRGILSRLGGADRARPITRLFRQVLPMLRRHDKDAALAHLHLYARNENLTAFADKVATLIKHPSWWLTYTRWQPELVRGVIGQHHGAVNGVAVTTAEGGRQIAVTGGDDGLIRVWDLTTGSQLNPLRDQLDDADPRRITALAAAELDGGTPLVVSGDLYGTVRVWDPARGRTVGKPLEAFANAGQAIAVGVMAGSPLLLCRTGNRMRLWSPTAQMPLALPFAVGNLSEMATSAILVEDSGVGMAAVPLNQDGGMAGEHVRVWDLAAGSQVGFPLRPAEGWATAVALARFGHGYAVVLGDYGGGLQAFDLTTGEALWDRVVDGLTITALASGDLAGQQVIVGGDKRGQVSIWELATGHRVSGPHAVTELDGGITAVGIVPSPHGGRLVVTGSRRVAPASPRESEMLRRQQTLLTAMFGELAADAGHATEACMVLAARPGPGTVSLRAEAVIRTDNEVISVAVANGDDHRVLVTSDGNQANLWNLITGERDEGPLCGSRGFDGRVRAIALTSVSAGRSSAVCGIGGTLHYWDIPTGVPLPDPELVVARDTINALAAARLDGTPLTVCGTWRSGARVIDPVMARQASRHDGIVSISSAAAGEFHGEPVVAFGTEDGSGAVLVDLRTGSELRPPRSGFERLPQTVSVAIITHGGRMLVVCGTRDRTLRLWDPTEDEATQQVIQVDGDVTCLAVTERDGYPVAVCGGPSGEVRLVDLVASAPGQQAVPAITALAVSGQQLICGTDNGIQVLDVATGAPLPSPVTGLREVQAIATGMHEERPIAVAVNRHGSNGRIWYLDTGEEVPTARTPRDHGMIESLVLFRDRGRTLGVFGTFDGQVVVTDLATGEETMSEFRHRERVTHIGVAMVADVPVIVSSGHGVVQARYLHNEDRPAWPSGFAQGNETPPQPAIFEDRVLPGTKTAYAMTIGTLSGAPFVARGNETGEVVLHSLTGLPLIGTPLTGSADMISALAFGQVGERPVLASGARDGTVRVWDLLDTRAVITIATLAGVNALALAPPDLCLIGTTKGLVAVRLSLPVPPGTREPIRIPHDVRADRRCPRHDTHERRDRDAARDRGRPGRYVVCIKGVQRGTRAARRRPPLEFANAHCWISGDELVIAADEPATPGKQIRYALTGVSVDSFDDPLGHFEDGCHYGIVVTGSHGSHILACYRRDERDRLLRLIRDLTLARLRIAAVASAISTMRSRGRTGCQPRPFGAPVFGLRRGRGDTLCPRRPAAELGLTLCEIAQVGPGR
jgi:WD40 repeat protein